MTFFDSFPPMKRLEADESANHCQNGSILKQRKNFWGKYANTA